MLLIKCEIEVLLISNLEHGSKMLLSMSLDEVKVSEKL